MVVESSLVTVQSIRAATAARTLLSLREATILADVPEQRVRKDIETGVLNAPYVTRINDAHLRTHWSFVFTLAAVYGNSCLNGKLRKRVLDEVVNSRRLADEGFFVHRHACREQDGCTTDFDRVAKVFASYCVSLDRFVVLDFSSVVKEVRPRVDSYVKGLMSVEERDDVLGGDAVFKGTRLPVMHIGKAYARGETMTNLLEDYPYLTEGDIEFAKVYFSAHPPVGRPPAAMEAKSGLCMPATG